MDVCDKALALFNHYEFTQNAPWLPKATMHYVTLVLHNTVYNTLPRQLGEFRIELASFPI